MCLHQSMITERTKLFRNSAGSWPMLSAMNGETKTRYSAASLCHAAADRADLMGGRRFMSKLCRVEVNGQTFSASRGELLLDAALMNGVDIPHDCRSGYCGSCRVRVLAGRCVGDAGSDPGIIHACQSRIVSDLKIEVEDVPDVV